MHWLLWLELIVLSLFMQSPIYTSDFAKMLIIFKEPGSKWMSLSRSRLQQLYLQYNSRHKHITGHNKFPVSIRVCMWVAEVYSMQACINIRLSNTQDCSFSMIYSFQLSTVWNGYDSNKYMSAWCTINSMKRHWNISVVAHVLYHSSMHFKPV